MEKAASRVLGAGLLAVSVVLWMATPLVAAPAMQQQITLQPGWNAVFLEVQPDPGDVESVLAGLPVESVWHWAPRGIAIQYIQDPGETLLKQQGWHAWFPESSGRGFLTTLFGLRANRAYLVKLGGSESAVLTVAGSPSLQREAWISDSFNLTGFSVDGDNPPSFGHFFSHSPAHEGQAIYRLNGEGAWQAVENPNAATMRPGEAFWIYTEGKSNYAGPLSVSFDLANGLDYGTSVSQRLMRVRNESANDRTVTLRSLSPGTSVPLSYLVIEPEKGIQSWPPMPAPMVLDLPAEGQETLTLAVRRAEIPDTRIESALELTDGQGARLLVPVSTGLPAIAEPAGARSLVVGSEGTYPFKGLWKGMVTLDKVTQAQIKGVTEFTTPQPTRFPFDFRLLVHVDGIGDVRLLKQVTHALDEGTGQWVLLTDDELMPYYSCPTLRDGEEFCYSLRSAVYDFAGLQLDLSGTFDEGGSLSGAIDLAPNHPTNPFKHAYHPDHDNKDALGNTIPAECEDITSYNPNCTQPMEAYRVTRTIQFTFASEPPPGFDNPDWDNNELLAGTYREEIEGLHRNTIIVSGTFYLQRLNDIASLNPEVAP